MFNVLVAEDDRKLNKLICTFLERNGYVPFGVSDGEAALEAMSEKHYDLLISDVMMPRMDGFELLSAVRAASQNMPVLIITAKDSFEDKRTAFSGGSDDYMVKPVDLEEMLLRVGALLKRASIATERKLAVGNLTLEYDTRRASIDGEEIQVAPKEFLLLFKLLSYPDKIFTRYQLKDEIWGLDSDSDDRTVDVHINHLREKFKDCDAFEIVTLRGLGYKAVRK